MRLTHMLALGATLVLAGIAQAAPVQSAALASPPPGAQHFVIQSTGGHHGDSWLWMTASGERWGRETLDLRGQVFDLDSRAVAGPDGTPERVTVRGFTPQGDAAEHFSRGSGEARWTSPIDSGHAPYTEPAFYVAQNAPMALQAWLLERLLASPHHTLKLLPGGTARADRLTSIEVGTGAARQRVTAWAVSGLTSSPLPLWTDARDRFFAQVTFLTWIPAAYSAEQKRLEDAQGAALARRSAQLAASLPVRTGGPVAFTHVRLFDAEARQFLADRTVIVSGSRIASVGEAGRAVLPANARVIDGRGATLLPGLWDCHLHVADDFTGLQELSLGVTSVRDPGNDDRRTMDRRTRARVGELLFPHVYPSSLIDGRGPYTAQVANVATSQAEAIALVRRAKANGFTGVKFYGTFNPAWLRASIAEAHRLGLHVHGHIPAGIRPLDAIEAGYDEVTHINWVIMQAMPDSVIRVSNGMARFEGPGRYGKDVDLNGPAMRSIISVMAARHIYNDPTMVAFESLYVPDNGDLSPAYAPFVGTMPPVSERNFRTGGFEVPKDLTRADYRASWAKMIELLRRMHQAGIPIVAGTDGSGIEIIRELEIYRQAGFTAADAIAAATIVPAILVGQAQQTGSIRPGKTADLVLVQGDPSQHLGDLRQTRWVMLSGTLLDADTLRAAAGFTGRPH